MQQRDIFDAPISVFKAASFDDGGKVGTRFGRHFVRTIGAFLNGGKYYADNIAALRSTLNEAYAAWARGDRQEYDRLLFEYSLHKWDSPLALLQGVCPSHDNNGFQSYTDIVCLDIDSEKPHKGTNGNEWVDDWAALRDDIAQIPYVAYCGLSAGGRGLFVLIPIKSHEQHSGHWRALCELFKEQHLTIDKATENMGRLRFMSYDPDARFNHNAVVFECVSASPAPEPAPRRRSFTPSDDTEERISAAVQEIEQRRIDITQSHDEWKKASAAIAHYFGERGRDIFHRIAAQYVGYSERENDRLYTNMMRSYAGQTADIASLFYLFKQYGITAGHPERGFRTPKVSPPTHHVQPISSTPLSPAEEHELKQRAQHIADGRAMVKRLREKSPALDYLCDRLSLSYCGHAGWEMTDAEFDAMMREHPEPPF